MSERKRYFRLFTAIFLATTCFFAGCSDDNGTEDIYTNQIPAGLQYSVPELPDMADFLDTAYEDYLIQFPPIQSVTLRTGDKETRISADDPRLIQLLNFLSFSMNESKTSWLQGYVTEDEINGYLTCKDTMLDITFLPEDEPANNTHNRAQRLILCGDSYLLILPTNSSGEIRGERYWPYSELPHVRHNTLSFSGEWGNSYWIDLLTYAGFVNQK